MLLPRSMDGGGTEIAVVVAAGAATVPAVLVPAAGAAAPVAAGFAPNNAVKALEQRRGGTIAQTYTVQPGQHLSSLHRA